jgi:hypothetical protein
LSRSDVWDAAVRAYWTGRDLQTEKQIQSGKIDAGTRGAMTGGQHMHALEDAVAEIFREDPDIGAKLEIHSKGKHKLPGYYRRAKDWDLVVLYRGALVAAIEMKSQPTSFSRNFNNRVEEAIGNTADLWKTFQDDRLGPIKPWLGFVILAGRIDESTKTLGNARALFPVDNIFTNTSYIDRYRLLLDRLSKAGQYDAGVVVESEPGQGIYAEPVQALSFANLEAAIAGRLAYIKALPDAAFKP